MDRFTLQQRHKNMAAIRSAEYEAGDPCAKISVEARISLSAKQSASCLAIPILCCASIGRACLSMVAFGMGMMDASTFGCQRRIH
jgi:hypothetical protein